MSNSPRVPIYSSAIAASMREINVRNVQDGRPSGATGVFASQPFMSPKYMRHRTNRNHEFEDTMARMFIKVAPDLYDKFIASLDDADTRRVAKVLAGDDVNKGGHGYIDFLLQSAVHAFSEKMQVSETLSDSYVAFFFGHAPPTFQYSGTLLNTYQDDWTMRMFRIFRDLARGTQMARRNLILRLRYDSMIVSGVMTQFQWSLTAGAEMSSPFSFNLLVKDIQVLYGGMSPPTKYAKEGSFTPEDFQLTGSGYGNGSAAQTYVGAPPGQPEGVSEELARFGSSSDQTDATGSRISIEAEEWKRDLNIV